MLLSPGTRVGSYEIVATLGEGGMGQVYRARDTRLKREVALKVLPPDVADDPGRLARFQREAEALASLNHPNIAQIYGVEDRALVMELVEGEDLSSVISRRHAEAERVRASAEAQDSRLARGGGAPRELSKDDPSLDATLAIARQIAVALEAAHEAGIVHRDLKPANVKVRPDGTVKVLDFGLAKMAEPSNASELDTATSPGVTLHGVIVGTPSYMSPEQARGLAVDKRTDIWAFGVVLFEMLTGKPLFQGGSVTDILAAIVREEPDFSELPASTPPSIRRLLRRCLEKDRRKRLPDIGVARLEIDEAGAPPEKTVSTVPTLPAPRSTRVPWLVAAVAVVALAIVATLWALSRRGPANVEWVATHLGGAELAMAPRVSPDGQLLAFLAMIDGLTQVAVMKPETGNWTVLTHNRSGVVNNFCWSRDGTKLFFDRVTDSPRGIYSVPVLGGDEQLVIENAMVPEVLPDGSLLVDRLNADRRYQLHRVWPDTGRSQALKFVVPWTTGGPSYRVTPAGDRAVVAGSPLDTPDAPPQLFMLDLASERVERLSGVQVLPSGSPMAVTPDGRSIVISVGDQDADRLVRLPLDGRSPVETLFTLTNRVEYIDLGADGSIYLDQRERPVEVVRVKPGSGAREHWADVLRPVPGSVSLPLPDGRLLTNTRVRGLERVMLAARGKELVPFLDTQEETGQPLALVGDTLVALTIGSGTNRTIALVSIATRRIVRRLEATKGVIMESLVASPDGKTLYYAASGSIWSIPSDDGPPKRLRKGDSVTMDATRRQLIVRLTDASGTHLVRQPLDGGAEQPIVLQGGLPIAPWTLWSTAVNKDGNLVLPLGLPDSWFWPLGMVDVNTGKTRVIEGLTDGDMAAGWTRDGLLQVNAMGLRSTMWRFAPKTAERPAGR